MENPYRIVKRRYTTEKARVLEQLQTNSSNPCVRRCQAPKAVFIVDRKANKIEIARAVEAIYKDNNVRVVAVNTSIKKPRERRRGKYVGKTVALKKAVVTFRVGDKIEGMV